MELKKILQPISRELSLVEQELDRLVRRMAADAAPHLARAGILGGIMRHPFAVPGKRIRPALVLLSARAAGGAEEKSIVQLASASEMLHAASLVHDDVIDGADTRRHQVSLNKKYGNRVAVLAGDILYTRFFSVITAMPISADRRMAILDTFLETTHAMCIGEILAQDTGAGGSGAHDGTNGGRGDAGGNGGGRGPAGGNGRMGFDEYLEISSDKTALLFRACCATAAIVCGADTRLTEALSAFGLSFGRVFQMVDDIMDGDARLDPRVDLAAKTLEIARDARDQARALPPAETRDALIDLLDFVLEQAFVDGVCRRALSSPG